MSDASPIFVRRQGDVVVLSLNRPERRDAIDRAMVDALHGALDDLEGSAVRAVIVMGVGGTFASGADIAELRDRKRGDALAAISSGLARPREAVTAAARALRTTRLGPAGRIARTRPLPPSAAADSTDAR